MKPEVLPEYEWDFTDVAAEEKRACLFYEYARESRAVLLDLAIWLKYFSYTGHFPLTQPWPSLIECGDVAERTPSDKDALMRFCRSPARVALVSPQFPDISWQQIDAESRRIALHSLQWSEVEQELAFAKKEYTGPALAKFAHQAFHVDNWGWTDEELIEQFRLWLKKVRSEPPSLSRRGRVGSPDDLLSHLGIFRLCRFAKIHRGSSKKVTEKSMEARNLTRATRKAAAFLENFYP